MKAKLLGVAALLGLLATTAQAATFNVFATFAGSGNQSPAGFDPVFTFPTTATLTGTIEINTGFVTGWNVGFDGYDVVGLFPTPQHIVISFVNNGVWAPSPTPGIFDATVDFAPPVFARST